MLRDAIVRAWRVATYRNQTVRYPPRRPAVQRSAVAEFEVIAVEVDLRKGILRVAGTASGQRKHS